MSNLFDINTEYMRLMHEIEDNEGEITPDVYDKLKVNQDELYEKSDQLAILVKQIEGEQQILKDEIKRLQTRIEQRDRAKEFFKRSLLNAVQVYGKFKTPKFSFSKMSTISVDVFDESKLADEFFVTKEVRTVSKTAIKEAVFAGKRVSGASIIKKEHLRLT